MRKASEAGRRVGMESLMSTWSEVPGSIAEGAEGGLRCSSFERLHYLDSGDGDDVDDGCGTVSDVNTHIWEVFGKYSYSKRPTKNIWPL